VGKGNASLRNYCIWEEYGSGTRLLVQQYNASGTPVLNLYSTTGLTLHTWYHVVAVREGAAVRLYLNGVLDAAGTASGAAATSTHPFTLAYAGHHAFFPGALDDVRLYNRALSEVEIPQLHRGVPRDTDGDGLPDYLEDLNGNGRVDPGETDPNNPVSNPATGQLDGEARAGPPTIWDKSYDCINKFDYSPEAGRHPKYPDTEFRMGWESYAPAWINIDCSWWECLPTNPPADFIVGERLERRWSSLFCGGTETVWFTNYAGQVTGGEPVGLTSIPPIPREKCSRMGGDFVYSDSRPGDPPLAVQVRRQASTDVRLSAEGSTWPKPRRSVVVGLTAVDKTAGQSLALWDTGCGSGEPDNRMIGPEIVPGSRTFELNGQPVDADGNVLLHIPKTTWDYQLRPVIACDWYQYDVVVRGHQIVRLTWSRHLNVTPAKNLQEVFDEAAQLLARDHDERIPDTDPRVTPGASEFNQTLYQSDDVPTYMEFIVIKGGWGIFPSNFNTPEYKDITDLRRLELLRIERFSNVKIVSSIQIGGMSWCGAALPDLPALVLANIQLDGLTVAHEFGHTAGLVHRGYTGNPGDKADTTAIMHEEHSGGTEANRHERSHFGGWNLPLWY
jgi:hypothetical protein